MFKLLFLAIPLFFNTVLTESHVDVEPKYIFIGSDEQANFSVHLRFDDEKSHSNFTTKLTFDRSKLNIEESIENVAGDDDDVCDATQYLLEYELIPKAASSGCINFQYTSLNTSQTTEEASLRYDIYRLEALKILSYFIRWVIVVLMAVSYYFQIYHNFTNQGVRGLDLNFLLFSTFEYLYYVISSLALISDLPLQIKALSHSDPFAFGMDWTYVSDVALSVHGLFQLLMIARQCAIYKTDQQTVYFGTNIILFVSSFGSVVCAIQHSLFLCIKLFVCYRATFRIIKYVPQMHLIYRRKSTEGLSIYLFVFEFASCLCYTILMLTDAYNFDSWMEVLTLELLSNTASILSICTLFHQFYTFKGNKCQVISKSSSSWSLSSMMF